MVVERKLNFEIDIDDYLDEKTLARIAEEELRDAVRKFFCDEKNVMRMITNISYDTVIKAVSDVWDGDLDKTLREKTKGCLNEKNLSYKIFYNDNYARPGIGTIILREMKDELTTIIREEAEKHIRNYPFHELDREFISETIADCISNRLFGNKDD